MRGLLILCLASASAWANCLPPRPPSPPPPPQPPATQPTSMPASQPTTQQAGPPPGYMPPQPPAPSFVVIKIDSQSAEGKMVIRLDGNELDAAAVKQPIQVSGGDHVIAATAPGYAPFSAEVSVKDQGDVQTVEIPILPRVIIAVTIPYGEHVGDHDHGFVGSISGGEAQDTTGIFSARGGVIYRFGRLALSADLDLTMFLRFDANNGIAGAGIGGDAEARFELSSQPRLRGLYLLASGGLLNLFGGPTKQIPEAGSATTSVAVHALAGDVRLGIAYGFPATKKATIAVRLAIDKTFFGYDSYFAQAEFPDPHPNPWVLSIGLEFMRWEFP